MIIACPQCDTRFVVPSSIFENGGRKVRCASCKYEWVQTPERDDDTPVYIDTGETVDSVERHLTEDINEHNASENENSSFIFKLKNDFKSGIKTIAAACVTILFLYFSYSLLTPSVIYGEGLAFNDMVILQEAENYVLTGEIVNTASEKRGVPSLKVTALLQAELEGDVQLVAADKEFLDSGEVISIYVPLDNIGPEIESINVTFEGAQNVSQADVEAENTADEVNAAPLNAETDVIVN